MQHVERADGGDQHGEAKRQEVVAPRLGDHAAERRDQRRDREPSGPDRRGPADERHRDRADDGDGRAGRPVGDEARQRPAGERAAQRGQVADLSAVDPGLSVTVSVGVASFPHHAADTDGILGAADAALLAAKARGRNCVYTFGDDEAHAGLGAQTPLAGLGRRFALRAGWSQEEADALAAALEVLETSQAPTGVLAAGPIPIAAAATASVDHLFAALLYGTERWDGGGYPEGLRGESIPRVARAFAVLRAYSHDGTDGGASLRAQAGRRFDPRMVNRFLAFLGEEASRWNPLAGVADEHG